MNFKRLAVVLAIAATAFGAGVAMGRYRTWPLPQINSLLYPDPSFGRLTSFPDKQRIACPKQTAKTRVLLIGGQSNAANKGGQRHTAASGARVINYFEGACYVAQSPLLGSQGAGGEYWTLVGDGLVAAGADQVILIPAAIFATSVKRWAPGGDLHPVLLGAADDAKAHYTVTDVLWDQGEEDLMQQVSAADYSRDFLALVDSLRAHGVKAPVFVSVATRCGLGGWDKDNPVATAQRGLAASGHGIHAGIDTDTLMGMRDRYDDCHLSASGLEIAARAWIRVLSHRQNA